jgi:adenine-specific DNA-methyltransferase
MQNLLNDLIILLKKDERLFSQNKMLMKNKVQELVLKDDENLIKLLLSDNIIKKNFFNEIDNILIFNKDKFISFINNKEFLPNSYTSFKNKIGLTSNNHYLKETNDVVLVWPYKDCILEGGMDKEEDKRDEIFFNEILSPDDINRLFDLKVLTNFKYIDKNGEKEFNILEKDNNGIIKDNLIIKGNNLLALHSLKKNFTGKIKLIYLDPPYNIGDDFPYNDKFNHSTWLTFMKNRLEISKQLLTTDGAIFVQIDHHEVAYLNVLMDEVFGIENKVQIISLKVSGASGFKAVNPGPIDVTEFILFYVKNKNDFVFQKNYIETGYHENYNLYLERADIIDDWKLIPLKDMVFKANGYKNEKEIKDKFGDIADIVVKNLISDFAFKHADNVVSIRDLHKPSENVKHLQEESRRIRNKIFPYKKQDGSYSYIINGGALAFYSSKIKNIDGKLKVVELLTNFWNHISWAGIANEGGVRLKNGKKPEKLIKQIIDIVGLKPGDIVLDFFLGSGTTCAVAHKLQIQYVGIEQLDYKDNDSVVRLKNVINGDQTGISKLVNWQGGGSFIYCELMKFNEMYIEMIKNAETKDKLKEIWNKMKEKAFLSYKVDVKEIDKNSKDFDELTIENQKEFLIECLDKNHLYVNLSEIDDTDYRVSEEDKKLNKLFYVIE